MENGYNYKVELDNGKNVTFLYDEDVTLSRAIKINQIGYQLNQPTNYAYVGGFLQEFGALDLSFTTFEVVDVNSGTVAYSGTVGDGR